MLSAASLSLFQNITLLSNLPPDRSVLPWEALADFTVDEAAEHIKDFKATLLVNFRVKSASIFALCVGKKKLFEKKLLSVRLAYECRVARA